ncbi:hypothetical protein ACR6C2_16810 [Streptomyces sp. INA 01156]
MQANLTARYGAEGAKRLKLARDAALKHTEYNKTEAAASMKAFKEVTAYYDAQEREKIAAKEKAARRRQRIDLNARNLEVAYGTDVANAYRANVERMLRDNKNLSVVRINEAKQWAVAEAIEARKVAAEHAKHAKAREVQVKSLSTLVIRQAQMEATEAAAAARTAHVAYTTAHSTRMAQILAERTAQRASSIATAQAALSQAQAAKKAAQQTIKANNDATRALQNNANKAEKSWTRAMYSAGSKVNAIGASTAEFGRNIQRNVTTPLLTAAAAMSALGVSAADSIMRSQTALKGIGINAKDSATHIQTLRQYGVETPYKVEDMFKYGAQYARSNVSHGMNSKTASNRATDLVMAVGDLAAFGGNTDPQMVERTLKAVGNIMESDRASLRNVRTIAESGGLDIQTLAQMLGFKDRQMTRAEIRDRQEQMDKMGVEWDAPEISKASGQMMLWMAKAAETGGVPGLAVTDALIKRAQEKDVGSGTDPPPGSWVRQPFPAVCRTCGNRPSSGLPTFSLPRRARKGLTFTTVPVKPLWASGPQ